MLITQRALSDIREASITDVVSHFIELKKHGKVFCPFHDEKTPSFSVTETKGIFKCFGCGRSGDGIKFVMEKQKVDFLEAVEKIALLTGVQLEYEEVEDKEKYHQEKAEADLLKNTLKLADERYKDLLWKMPEDSLPRLYLAKRGISKDDILEWGLGWAETEWGLITSSFKQQSLYDPAQKLGLIRRTQSGDSYYDVYRSRITIPIVNHNGETVGLAGRWILIDPNDELKNYPKYINPPENAIYSKSKVLFGLDRAAKAIRQQGFAFLVEGYFDVISMHKNGDENTVASCGTAFTLKQVELLKKYTDRVVLLPDGDSAGVNSAKKDLPILLKAGFRVDVMLLPGGEDPDTYISKLSANNGLRPLSKELEAENAIMWQVKLWVTEADGNPDKLGMAKQDVVKLLSYISSDMTRSNYVEDVCKKYRWKKTELQKQLSNVLDEKKEEEASPQEIRLSKLPNWMDQEEFMKKGYSTVNNKNRTGYYSVGQGGVEIQISNFIIKPLFHIYAGKDSRLMIQIDNGKLQAVLDIENKILTSKQLLQDYTVTEGNFVIPGSQANWLRIASDLLENFPKCQELKLLGWQRDGFFAFVDKVFVPGVGLKELNEWGIVQQNEKYYLIPAACSAYNQLKGQGDDPYLNQRVLTYVPATINFSEWAELMYRVYEEKGLVAIAYTILTVFRDIIFPIDNNVPHLYGFGERSAGKSKWAESIGAFFYKGRTAFNLNSGTEFAFFHYMQLFCNCPALLNEFDEKTIRPEFFQSIKGVFDGEGRQRGVGKDRTETMQVKSTLVLTGQFLCTMDDNSIVSRCIIEGFNERDLTEEDQQEFRKLKALEELGFSSLLTEVLKQRGDFMAQYKDSFTNVLSRWRESISTDTSHFNLRVMKNWCLLFTCYDLMSRCYSMPVGLDVFENYCKGRAVYWSGFMRSGDTLSQFWNSFAFLANQRILTAGWDYIIKTQISVRIKKDKNDETLDFTEPTKVIYIRMNIVHAHYQKNCRDSGKVAMTLENLEYYFSSRKYYIGRSKQSKFKRWVNEIVSVSRQSGQHTVQAGEYSKELQEQNSSSTMFFYDDLNINIENTRSDGTPDSDDAEDNQNLPFPL